MKKVPLKLSSKTFESLVKGLNVRAACCGKGGCRSEHFLNLILIVILLEMFPKFALANFQYEVLTVRPGLPLRSRMVVGFEIHFILGRGVL